MQDNICGTFDNVPNDNYRKFFNKFSEISTLPISDWKPVHLIGYFAKKYSDTYHTDYKFKFNHSAPSKCFEMFQIKKLGSLLTSDPVLLKQYMDWVFAVKIVKAKRKISSISCLTIESTMIEYKINVLLNTQSINRTTELSADYKTILVDCGYPVNTYGDIAFLYQISDMPENLLNAFELLQNSGFDINLLSKVV
jgi:hypothetical protein